MNEREAPPRVHYIHRTSYSFQERLVGFFVLAALAVLLGLIFVNSKTAHLFDESVKYHAYLKSAEGISAETVVKVSGLEVGRVVNVDVAPDNRIHVTFEVYSRYQRLIRTDSKASLGKLSVLGKSTIDITAGTPASPVLADGTVITVAEPMSVDELIAKLTPVMDGISITIERVAQVVGSIDPRHVNRTLTDLSETAHNVRAITEQLASGKGSVGAALYSPEMEQDVRASAHQLERTLTEATARLAELQPMIEEAKGVARDSKELTKDFPELVRESAELVRQMRSTVNTFNTELHEFPDLVNRMKVLMDQTERTLDSISRTWPVSTTVPAPAPAAVEVQPVQ